MILTKVIALVVEVYVVRSDGMVETVSELTLGSRMCLIVEGEVI